MSVCQILLNLYIHETAEMKLTNYIEISASNSILNYIIIRNKILKNGERNFL